MALLGTDHSSSNPETVPLTPADDRCGILKNEHKHVWKISQEGMAFHVKR